MTTKKQTAEPGAVSSDTMRPRDLIPKFLCKLDCLDQTACNKIEQKYKHLFHKIPLDENTQDTLSDDDHHEINYLLEELFDTLDEYAPDNHYFGAHPDDGACYGFWKVEDSND